jgi:hypothetical protein
MSRTVHTPFVQLAAQQGIEVLEAIMTAHINGLPISFDGRIGVIDGEPGEDDLFGFRCPDTGFEDLVPADALALVSQE